MKYCHNPQGLQIQPVSISALGTQCTLFREVCVLNYEILYGYFPLIIVHFVEPTSALTDYRDPRLQ